MYLDTCVCVTHHSNESVEHDHDGEHHVESEQYLAHCLGEVVISEGHLNDVKALQAEE